MLESLLLAAALAVLHPAEVLKDGGDAASRPSEATEPVTVRLRLRHASRHKDRTPSEGEPVSLGGLHVDVWTGPDPRWTRGHRDWTAATRLGGGTTDEEGRFEGIFPAAPGAGQEIFFELVEPGFQRRTVGWKPWTASLRHPGRIEEQHAASLLAVRGVTLAGHVTDADGIACAAEVQFFPHGQSISDRLRGLSFARTGPDGSFRFSVGASSGLPEPHGVGSIRGRLVAISANDGLGITRDVELSGAGLNADLRIVLAGEAAIAGVVRSAGGVPIAGLPLCVLGEGANLRHGHRLNPVQAAAEDFETPGLIAAYCTTDINGQFLARGLRAGIDYEVRLDRGTLYEDAPWKSLMEPGPPLTRKPVRADGRSLDLTFERPHLVVEVIDGDGVPSSLQVTGPRPVPGHPGLPAEWPDHPFVIVLPAELGPNGPLVADRSGIRALRGLPAGRGAMSFPIERDQGYLVSVIGRGAEGRLYSGRPEFVRLDRGQERVIVRASPMPENVSMGGVEVSLGGETLEGLEDHHGAPGSEFIPVKAFSHGGTPDTVEDPGTGVTLLVASLHWGRTEMGGQLRLPEGRYRFGTRLMPFRSDALSELHGEGVELVDVRAGQTAQAALVAGPLSRIQLSFQPREGLDGGKAMIWLRNARGERRPLTRVVERRFPDVRMSSEWPKGVACTSAWCPTGAYDLLGQIGDGPMVVLEQVNLEPWKTLQVDL